MAGGSPSRPASASSTSTSTGSPVASRSWIDMTCNRHRGFSLLEVLVAFVIVALVATALFRLFGGALNNASAAGEWSRALLLAESRLALAANVVPLREASD